MTRQPLITERRVVLDGMTTRTLEVEGSGPPILLLHGFTDSADTWRPVLAELAHLGRRAAAVDLPGHGHAQPLQQPVLETLDTFVESLLGAYADEPAVLAGNSLGGMLAFRAAGRRGLPLLAVAGLGPAGLAYTRRMELIATSARILDPVFRLFDALPIPQPLVSAWARRVHRRLSEGMASHDLAVLYASHFRGPRALARLRSDLIALSEVGDENAVDVHAIDVPVLMLWGERDHLAHIRGADKILSAVADSRLVALDAGHCPQLQMPAEIAAYLADLPAIVQQPDIEEPA